MDQDDQKHEETETSKESKKEKNQEYGKQIVKTYNQLVEQRSTLERYWKAAYRYTKPERGQLFGTSFTDGASMASNAMAEQSSIFDSTATESVRLLATSIMSGITPSSSQWFQFRIPGTKFENLPQDARIWLEDAGKTLFNLIHNSSNYNAEALEAMEDMGIAGMVGLAINKEPQGKFIFEIWPLDTMYVQENIKTKTIDTIYRLVLYTASEAIQEFGEDNVPDSIKNLYKANADDPKQHEFIHLIRPRNGKKGPFKKQLPIASTYVCKKSGTIVKDDGFNETPVVVPRWSKLPRTPYAIGPVTTALPDIKTLNKVVEMMLQNEEMAIAGTFVAKFDGQLNPNTTVIGPRKIIFAQDPGNIKPLTTGGDFRIAFEEITRLQRQIKSVMMADELEPIQKNYASATEVAQRSQIIRQILGPVFSRLQSEFLEPMLTRCFNLALRDGSLGQPPQVLNGVEIIPEYVSPMARAQRMEEVSAMAQFEQSLAQTAQLNPGVLDLYNFDSATLRKAQLLGVPADVLRSKEQVVKLRNQQAKQQAEAQQQAQMQQMTDPKMAKVALDAVGGSDGLKQMMNEQG